MGTIKVRDWDAEAEREFEVAGEWPLADGARLVRFVVPEIGDGWEVSAVAWDDGTVISTSDWQGLQPGPDGLAGLQADEWADCTPGGEGGAVVVIDGLPRLLG